LESAARVLDSGKLTPRNPATIERPPKGKTMKNSDSDYTAADIIADWSTSDREVRVLRSYAAEIETIWEQDVFCQLEAGHLSDKKPASVARFPAI
jgi:hypothetical protein